MGLCMTTKCRSRVSKALRNPISVSRGTGPVCAKHVAEFIAAISAQTAERIRQSWARRRDEMVGVNEMAIANAKARGSSPAFAVQQKCQSTVA